MGAIERIPDTIVYDFQSGATFTGVAPAGASSSFKYDNESGGPFEVGEVLSWSGPSTGILVQVPTRDSDEDTGSMVIAILTGSAPIDGQTITGGTSGATADVDGNVKSGGAADSEESIRRGRYRWYAGLTNGGLIEIDESVAHNGFGVREVLLSTPGITAVDFYIVDRFGHDVNAGSVSPSYGDAYREWRSGGGMIIAPGCKFKMVGTGTLSAVGRVMINLCKGWGSSAFDDAPSLGKSNRPPGP
jgi:hypothetical protein